MSEYLIRPEELMTELSKAYPQPKVRRVPRPSVPRVTFASENLYGALVYVCGEGVMGQYLRHEYFYRELERYWAIELGWVTLYGRLKKEKGGLALPLVVMGMPTRYVYQYKVEDFAEYLLEEVPVGYLEVREPQIVNLERCMQGRDAVLIIDKYGIFRQDGFATPSELVDKIVELQRVIENHQRALWEYEKNVHELEATSQMLQAENAKLRELIRDFKSRFQRLAAEVTSIQMELIRLREDAKVRAKELEAAGRVEAGYKNIIDGLEDTLKRAEEHIRFIAETLREIEAAAEAAKPAKPPAKVQAKAEKGGGGEGEEE